MIQILKDKEVYEEYDSADDQGMFRRARIRAEILTRDNDGEFTAVIVSEETEVSEEIAQVVLEETEEPEESGDE